MLWRILGTNSRPTLNAASTPKATPKAFPAFSGPLVLGGCHARDMRQQRYMDEVGDPARGQEKLLIVVFEFRDGGRKSSVREGDFLELP